MSMDRDQGACIASTFVAMQLIVKIKQRTHILYQNPHVCSAYGCRPIRLWFKNESSDNAKQEIARLKKEARELIPFKTRNGVIITFTLFMSMCDMKIENFKWQNTSAMRCPFCRRLQSEFHLMIEFLGDQDSMGDCCISVLHFLIRSFEHFLKVFTFASSYPPFKR